MGSCKGEEPEHVGNRVLGLVVGWDSNVNPVKWGVCIAKGNNWDVHVGGFSDALVVKSGVANDHKSWLQEPIIKYKLELKRNQTPSPYLLLRVLVSQCSWDPLSAKVVGISVSGELEDGALGILS